MPQLPLVSVIVPTYNQADTIIRALDSIVSQVCDFEYEVLVGDDASSDATPSLVENYALSHPQIRLIKNSFNKGLVGNYYNLVKRARGRYIADCGGDDAWCDTAKLQLQADILNSQPDVVMVHTDWNYYNPETNEQTPCDPAGVLAPYRHPLTEGGDIFMPLLKHALGVPVIHSCTLMYRRKAAVDAMMQWPELFFDSNLVCEDLQLLTALARIGKVAYIPRVTLLYSVHGNSITGNKTPENLCKFYSGSLHLTRMIQTLHQVPDRVMRTTYGKMTSYIIGKAFDSRSRSLMHQSLLACSGMPVPLKARLKISLSRFICWKK